MFANRRPRLINSLIRIFGCAALSAAFCFSTGETCQAQLFSRVFGWNSRPQANAVQYSPRSVSPYRSSNRSYRSVEPVTGYGSNLHRNFTIRQQQQRAQAGLPLINRNNVLLRPVR